MVSDIKTIEYFRSVEDDFVFYALQHCMGAPYPLVYVYRKKGFSANQWEYIDRNKEPSAWEYCHEKVHMFSRATPITKDVLQQHHVPLISDEMAKQAAGRAFSAAALQNDRDI